MVLAHWLVPIDSHKPVVYQLFYPCFVEVLCSQTVQSYTMLKMLKVLLHGVWKTHEILQKSLYKIKTKMQELQRFIPVTVLKLMYDTIYYVRNNKCSIYEKENHISVPDFFESFSLSVFRPSSICRLSASIYLLSMQYKSLESFIHRCFSLLKPSRLKNLANLSKLSSIPL